MNKVFLIGRLTRNPELRYLSNNTAVASFSLAVNRPFTNQNGERTTDFINIVVWRRQAENVKKYIGKGSQVAIEGRIQTRNYDDKDGKRVYITEIIADNVQFLDSRKSNEQSDVSPQDFNNLNQDEDNNLQQNDEGLTTDVSDEPFAEFGETIELSEDDIAF